MKDEIKEILDRMQELVKHKYDKEIHTYNLFDDIQGLLDYITNLQQENDRLNNIINYIWQVFENGGFEDGCDCIEIYDYLKELKENNCE